MKNLILLTIALTTKPTIASSDVHQLLGISSSPQKASQAQPLVPKPLATAQEHLEKKLPTDSTLSQLLSHTKVKKRSQQEICCGIKMDYKLSKKLSLSVDVMAQVEEKSYKIKSKEANIHFAISL